MIWYTEFVIVWFEIISELFVNISAAWFAVVFIGPQISPLRTTEDFLLLMLRVGFGIISLFTAKYFRQKSRRKL